MKTAAIAGASKDSALNALRANPDWAKLPLFDRKGWQRVRFGDVVRVLKEQVDPASGDVDRYVAGEHMETENVHIRNWGNVGDGYLGPAFIRRFRKGQVLYGSRRTYLKKVAVAEWDGVTSNTTLVLEAVEGKLLQKLLPWLMLSERFTRHSIQESKGSTNPYINWPDIAKFEFDLPPLDQQRSIAEILWATDSALQPWLSTSVLLSTVDLQLSKSFLSQTISKKGHEAKLGNFIELVSGQHISAEHYSDQPPGTPYLTGPADFPDGVIKVSRYTTVPKVCCRKGDILVTCKGSGTGKIVEADAQYCISRQLMAARPRNIRKLFLLKILHAFSKELNTEAKGLIPVCVNVT